MIPENEEISLETVDSIEVIAPESWNRLATRPEYSPFLEYEFLSSIERNRCAAPETGWRPRHFILKHGGRIVGAAPAYVKAHSMGEFIFDQGIAQFCADWGMEYYPKLVATIPFTPSPGYRFLIDAEYRNSDLATLLLKGMQSYRDTEKLASHSILFADPSWNIEWHGVSPPLRWAHQYFLWQAGNDKSFPEFLSRFSKNQRRNIRRERASIQKEGIRVRVFTGDEISEALMDQMFNFYRATNENFGPWAAFFLNRQCFQDIRQRWAHRLLLFTAWTAWDSGPVAMSLLVRKGKSLTGRYWGAARFIPNLHFELCYYAPIEYALQEGITEFDPGMGSVHKTRRGFGSREFGTYHAFADKRITQLFAAVLPEINAAERQMIEALEASVPWKRRNDGPGTEIPG